MKKAVFLFAANGDPGYKAISAQLRARYGSHYRLVEVTSAAAAHDLLAELKQKQELLALALAVHNLPEPGGSDLLLAIHKQYPDAGKALLTSHTNIDTAITTINQAFIDRYLVQPWLPAEARLFPSLDELLNDWQAAVQLPAMRVRGIMTVPPVRIRESSSLYHAAEIVALSGVGDLMVVDENGGFVGVLSEGDILRAALPDIDEILEEGGTPADAFQLFLRKGHDLANKPIAPLIIRQPLVVKPTDHVAKVATLLIERQIRRLPVLQNGRLLGTVSRANICQAVVGTL